MKFTAVETEALYDEGKVDTQGKPFSACKMVFSPHGGDKWVFGATEEVQAYWDSLTCSFDFNWFIFNSESDMMEYLKGIENIYSGCLSATFHAVKECPMNEPPSRKSAMSIS